MKKFDIYASTRRLRQAAGDKAEEYLAADKESEWRAWRNIEEQLNNVESKLERMNLKEDNSDE